MHRGTGSETMPHLCIKRRSYRSYNLPVSNIAIINLACFTAFQFIPWQAYLADCSSYDWLFRCISHTSTPANVGLSHGKACLAASPALQHSYYFTSVSSQTHHYTGQGTGGEESEMPLLSFGWQDRCWSVHLSLGGNMKTMLQKEESEIP